MKTFNKSTIKAAIASTAAVLAVTAGATTLFAWTSAPSSPPAGNVSAPVNVGASSQAKSGALGVNGFQNDGASYLVGSVGIGVASPSYKLQVGSAGDGSGIGSNIFLYISDARLKKNVSTLEDALSKVLQLRGVSFDWKSTGAPSIGVIAQEVEKVYPEIVHTDASGIKSVEYGNLVAPLIEAVKAQQTEIDSLKARIAALEAKQ